MLCLLHPCQAIITSLTRHRPSIQTLRSKQIQSESWELDETSKHEDMASDPICKQERCTCAPSGHCASWKDIGRTSPVIVRQDPCCIGQGLQICVSFKPNEKTAKNAGEDTCICPVSPAVGRTSGARGRLSTSISMSVQCELVRILFSKTPITSRGHSPIKLTNLSSPLHFPLRS